MSEELKRKLVNLEQELLGIKNELEKTLSEIYDLEKRRRNLFLKIRELKHESKACRDRLNILREEIEGLNETLSSLRKEKSEKISTLRSLKEKIREYLRTKPRPRMEEKELESQVSSLEWIIQTSPLPLNEEKRVIAKIKSLEEQLYFYRNLRFMKSESQAIKNSIEETKKKINECVCMIAEKISERKRIRERLIGILKEIDEMKLEVNRINEEYDGKRVKVSELRSRYKDLLSQITAIKRGIREEEEKRKAEHESILREKIRREVLERIKRGEKVSFEEFKVLLEESIEDGI
ncbi:MAG: hypothetical protein QXJ19_00340 [Candidatus Bathyarchaeia archaeon]|nr:hypothetical protein [Candidatus Bathyarchaeota archaeon]